MKKILSLLLCGILLISALFGCSQADTEQFPTADNAVGDDMEDNIIPATSESLEEFYYKLWNYEPYDCENYAYINTTYEYTLSSFDYSTLTDLTLSGNSVTPETASSLINFIHSIKPDLSTPWESMDHLLGQGPTSRITITTFDDSVLTVYNISTYHRYILTHPDGTKEKAICTCDADYLADFLIELLCNEKTGRIYHEKRTIVNYLTFMCCSNIIIFSFLRPDVPEEPTLLEEFYQKNRQ